MSMPGRTSMQIARKRGATAQLPGFLSQAQQSLAGAQKGLQEEAQKYVQSAREQQYGLGEDVIQKAAQGDQEAYQQTAQRLSQQGPGMVQEFRPETKTQIQDIEALRSDAGIRQMLGRQAGGQYSAGESALDLAIMRRNPQFNLIREQLLRGQGQLQEEALKQAGERTAEARQIAQERYGQATQDIQGKLGAQAEAIKAEAAKRALAENEARKALGAQAGQFTEEQARAELAKLQQEMAADTRMAGLINEELLPYEKLRSGEGLTDEYKKQLNLGQYYKGPQEVTGEQMVNQEEADRFNRIMGLLGQGGQMMTPQEKAAAQGFDVEKFRGDIIGSAQKKRQALDEQLGSRIQGITRGVQEREMGLTKQYEEDLRKNVDPQVSNVYSGLAKQYKGLFDAKDIEKLSKKYGINPMDYAKGGKVDQYSTLTQDEVSQLKDAYRQLGQNIPPGLAQAGKGGGSKAEFDRQGFEAALQSKLRSEAAAKSQAKMTAAKMAPKIEQEKLRNKKYATAEEQLGISSPKRGGR